MLWGRIATSSPSLDFSKTFTSTNYPGERKTKNSIYLGQRQQPHLSQEEIRGIKFQHPGSWQGQDQRSSFLPHSTPPPQRPSRHTHTHTRAHGCIHVTPLPSPSTESQREGSLEGWPWGPERKEERYTAGKPPYGRTLLSWTVSICSDTGKNIYEVLSQET